MSDILTAPNPPAPGAATATLVVPDFSKPVQRSKKGVLKLAGEVLRHGGPGYYRDPGVLQFMAINASDAWHTLKAGKLAKAAGHVFDSRNLTSLKAVWEDRQWISGV